MNEKEEFFKLLKYSNKLKQNKKSLRKEAPEIFKLLLKFLVRISDNFHYSEKQAYIELAKDFLSDQITADDFSYGFMGIYEEIGTKLGQMKRDESLKLANFLNPNRPEIGDLLARIYGSCDSFNPDPEIAMSNEKELKECAQILLSELQEE